MPVDQHSAVDGFGCNAEISVLSIAAGAVREIAKVTATIERTAFLDDSDSLIEGLRMGGVGVWRWRIESDILAWTENLERVHGLPAGAFDGTLASFQRDIHPDDTESVWEHIQNTLLTGEPYRAVYRTRPRYGDEALWIETSGGIVTDAEGVRYLTGICQDVTARVRGEKELQSRLRQQRAIEQFGSFALAENDFQKVLDGAVAVAAEVLDLPLTKILQFADAADHLVLQAGLGWHEGLVGDACVGIEKESQAGFTLMSDGPVIVTDLLSETRFSGPQLLHDHGVRSGMSVVIAGMDRRPFGVFGVHDTQTREFADSELEFFISLSNIVANSARQHAADAHRDLLLREMAHRAGNMLQLVSTIANQTFVGDDIDAARHSFSERLGSLSRANYLVAQGGWTSTRIITLLEQALHPFLARLKFSGRDVLLPPDLSFDLGLIVHELATNSAKYGALGSGGGIVEVRWRLSGNPDDGRFLKIVWDDPRSSRMSEATRAGFGSKLLAALIERKWGGEIVVEREQGYRYGFTLRLPE
jgi:PAS domain S-box-containing protein